jgi:hypothetical protein
VNAEPEPEHRCFSLTNEAGEVDAVVHGDPNMSPEALAALNEVVAAAKRQFEADLAADPSIGERQAAARAHNRARLERLTRQRRLRRLFRVAFAATLVAAVLAGRRAVGIELEHKYADITVDRLREAERIADLMEAM